MQGAPITSFDVDIVHHRTAENVDRLMAFLAGVGARYRNRPGPPLPPSRQALLNPGHSFFVTDLGPLDALGAIEGGADYNQLRPLSMVITVAGRSMRVLSLETIVAFKRLSTDAKDKLRLPIVEEVLRRRPK